MIVSIFLFFLIASIPAGNGKIPSKIVGGSRANLPVPYQVSIRMNGDHICGGSIIDSLHILTAAHCVISDDQQLPAYVFQVFVGATEKYDVYGEEYQVLRYDYHYQYSSKIRRHDIAIITLTRKIIFSNTVQPINPPQNHTSVGTIATASGYGAVDYRNGKPILTNQLHKLELKIVDNEACGRAHDSRIFPDQICAYMDRGRGMCIGDSGGPLVVNGQLVGQVNWGRPCAKNVPDVFVRVFSYLPWIKSILNAQAR